MQHGLLGTLLRPILSLVRGLVRRGAVARAAESPKGREIQVRVGFGDLRDQVEHLEPYGFTSSPLGDAEALVLAVGADRSHSVAAVVFDHRARPTDLGAGDVCIYAASGARVILRRGGGIEAQSPSPISITAPEMRVTGDVKVTGSVQASGDVSDGTRSMAADRVIFNQHTHAGVQTGSGTSGPPLPQQ